jgi:hypothetical protein
MTLLNPSKNFYKLLKASELFFLNFSKGFKRISSTFACILEAIMIFPWDDLFVAACHSHCIRELNDLRMQSDVRFWPGRPSCWLQKCAFSRSTGWPFKPTECPFQIRPTELSTSSVEEEIFNWQICELIGSSWINRTRKFVTSFRILPSE